MGGTLVNHCLFLIFIIRRPPTRIKYNNTSRAYNFTKLDATRRERIVSVYRHRGVSPSPPETVSQAGLAITDGFTAFFPITELETGGEGDR